MHCNKILPLYTACSGQTDDAGNYKDGAPMFVRNVSMDFQPYSTEEFLKDYGYSLEVSHQLLIQDASGIEVGMCFMDGDLSYEIRKIVPWDSYSEVFVYGV